MPGGPSLCFVFVFIVQISESLLTLWHFIGIVGPVLALSSVGASIQVHRLSLYFLD